MAKNLYIISGCNGAGKTTASSIIKSCTRKLWLMSDKEYQDLNRRLDDGLRLAHQRMLEEKALHNETVVVSTTEGKIEYLSAREVLATF